MSRDTTTGKDFEDSILPSLERGAYQFKTQENIGKRIGGNTYRMDCVAEDRKKIIFISLKWQQTTGTAEQKIPYEVICLAKAVMDYKTKTNKEVEAYLVLGGIDKNGNSFGWTLRNFYINEGLKPYLNPDCLDLVKIIKTDNFIALANRGQL